MGISGGLDSFWQCGEGLVWAYSESSTIWDTNGKVGEDCEDSIREGGFEGEVMGDFMNG